MEGDETAADALTDWCLENRRHPQYDLRRYVDGLEDALRECKRTVMSGRDDFAANRVVRFPVGSSLLTKGAVDKIYALCFACEREAKHYKRMGPA